MGDGWQVRQSDFTEELNGKYESLFSLGNGYLGLRGTLEEATPCYKTGTYINGLYETNTVPSSGPVHWGAKSRQTILSLPSVNQTEILVNDELLSVLHEGSVSHERLLDLRSGAVVRKSSWKIGDSTITLKTHRLVSLQQKSYAFFDYAIDVKGQPVSLVLRCHFGIPGFSGAENGSGEEYRGNEQQFHGFETLQLPYLPRERYLRVDGVGITCDTKNSGLSFFSGVVFKVVSDLTFESDFESSQFEDIYIRRRQEFAGAFQLQGRMYFEKTETTASTKKFHQFCISKLRDESVKFEKELESNKEMLADFWNTAEIAISGNPDLQKAAQLNAFHLFQSAGRDGTTGLAIEGSDGHFFSDTEIYALPFFIYTVPSVARSLLHFRFSMLHKARQRAAALSHGGALFPRRTINGDWVPDSSPIGTAQYHINADILYGFTQYIAVAEQSAGEDRDMLRMAYEIAIEIARFYFSLGAFIPEKNGAFCLNTVTGPDEYAGLVNNNLYTNLMVRFCFLAALDYHEKVENSPGSLRQYIAKKVSARTNLPGAGELEDWKQAAEKMYLPFHDERLIHEQDDSFLSKAVWNFEGPSNKKHSLILHFHPLEIYRHQVIQQADVVLAQFLMGQEFSRLQKKRNFDYYEPLTTGDSPLSACAQGIMAAELGYLELALKYYTSALRIDLDDIYGNSRDGVNTTAIGGAWMVLVYGFAGLREIAGQLHFAPRLPTELGTIGFTLVYKERKIHIEMDQENACYTLIEGGDMALFHRGEKLTLRKNETAKIGILPELKFLVCSRYLVDQIKPDVASLGIEIVPMDYPKYLHAREFEEALLVLDLFTERCLIVFDPHVEGKDIVNWARELEIPHFPFSNNASDGGNPSGSNDFADQLSQCYNTFLKAWKAGKKFVSWLDQDK